MEGRLPQEVVTHIMQYLSVSDRKDAALVNRTWYEASLDPILQKDIIIHFYASSAAATGRAIPSLSKRRLPHLVLNEFDSSLDAKAVLLKSCEHLAVNLKSLSLRSSNITESSFVELLSQCKNLVSLDLSCCNSLFMSGQLLEKNSDIQLLQGVLSNVTNLNLSSIRYLSDATFNRIVTICENVEKLSIASAQLTFRSQLYIPRKDTHCASNAVLTYGNFLDFIASQQCLKSLNLSRTQIGDEHLEELAMSGLCLEELILIGCRNVSDEGIAYICKQQPNLVSLDLSECPDLTNGAVKSITMFLKKLKNLNLNKCRLLNDASIMTLEQLRCLEELDISECSQVTSTGLIKGLCQKRISFTNLNLRCCSSVSDSFVLKACICLPYLTHLDLGSCFPISDASVHVISSYLKYLRTLRLSWCKVTDLGLLGLTSEEHAHLHQDMDGECRCNRKYSSTVIFKKPTMKKEREIIEKRIQDQGDSLPDSAPLNNLVGLRHLDLMSCKNLTDTSLAQVIRFPELKVLVLGMIPGLTEEGIIKIVKSNPSIEELNLYQSAKLTDDAVEVIATKLLRLQTLNIFGCDKLSDTSIGHIKKNCTRLKNLDVSFCGGISMEAMENLEQSLKTLVNVQKRMIGS